VYKVYGFISDPYQMLEYESSGRLKVADYTGPDLLRAINADCRAHVEAFNTQ